MYGSVEFCPFNSNIIYRPPAYQKIKINRHYNIYNCVSVYYIHLSIYYVRKLCRHMCTYICLYHKVMSSELGVVNMYEYKAILTNSSFFFLFKGI